jgi:hypothetical protein
LQYGGRDTAYRRLRVVHAYIEAANRLGEHFGHERELADALARVVILLESTRLGTLIREVA